MNPDDPRVPKQDRIEHQDLDARHRKHSPNGRIPRKNQKDERRHHRENSQHIAENHRPQEEALFTRVGRSAIWTSLVHRIEARENSAFRADRAAVRENAWHSSVLPKFGSRPKGIPLILELRCEPA